MNGEPLLCNPLASEKNIKAVLMQAPGGMIVEAINVNYRQVEQYGLNRVWWATQVMGEFFTTTKLGCKHESAPVSE